MYGQILLNKAKTLIKEDILKMYPDMSDDKIEDYIIKFFDEDVYKKSLLYFINYCESNE